MNKKNVLITGANKSIGFETARQLGLLGYGIWLGSRDQERGQKAAEHLLTEKIDVRVLTIDVTSEESVQAAATRVQQEDGRLDLLINNAGISGSMACPASRRSRGFRRSTRQTYSARYG